MSTYTRTGDSGVTGLFGKKRLPKSHSVFELLGNLDELNAFIGNVLPTRIKNLDSALIQIQNDLFHLGSKIAGADIPFDFDKKVACLEGEMDKMDSVLPGLTSFILPGGSTLASKIHIARAICRRAERCAVSMQSDFGVIKYLNRLSDYLFVCARFANHKLGVADVLWKK